MTRQKKSRKPGKIGISKSETPKRIKTIVRNKIRKGNKPGSRHSAELGSNGSEGNNQRKDPRIGSKKPIDLSKYNNKEQNKDLVEQKFFSPQEELDAIESDPKLDALLEKQESNKLSQNEQDYLDKKMARHKQLCELLGIDDAEEDSTDNEELDPFTQLDAIKLDDFKK